MKLEKNHSKISANFVFKAVTLFVKSNKEKGLFFRKVAKQKSGEDRLRSKGLVKRFPLR